MLFGSKWHRLRCVWQLFKLLYPVKYSEVSKLLTATSHSVTPPVGSGFIPNGRTKQTINLVESVFACVLSVYLKLSLFPLTPSSNTSVSLVLIFIKCALHTSKSEIQLFSVQTERFILPVFQLYVSHAFLWLVCLFTLHGLALTNREDESNQSLVTHEGKGGKQRNRTWATEKEVKYYLISTNSKRQFQRL